MDLLSGARKRKNVDVKDLLESEDSGFVGF